MRYLDVYPTLTETAQDEVVLAPDLAEHSLFVEAASGEPKARQFLLSPRGYVRRKEVAASNSSALPLSQQRITTVIIDGATTA